MSERVPVLILLDSHERWRFFRRLSRVLHGCGYQAVFLTYQVSIYLQVRRETDRVALAPCVSTVRPAPVERACDVLSGKLSQSNARLLYSGCRAALERLERHFNFHHALIWNGSDTAARAVSDWATERGVLCGFLEIGNLPGKLFVDPKGVNAQSHLAAHPELLDSFPDADVERYQKWHSAYVQTKVGDGNIPQSQAAKRINWWALMDRPLAGWVSPIYESQPFWQKALAKLAARTTVFDYDKVDLAEGEPFIFFPMQVRADSQILLNSDVSIEQALMYAVDQARQRGFRLIVRPHPAETDMAFVRKILQLKRECGFLFSKANIFSLMDRAALVITINSTAGLESMILGTEVICLGRCFYHDFDQRRLRQYVMNFLVDIDYFDDKSSIREIEARTFLGRLDWPVLV